MYLYLIISLYNEDLNPHIEQFKTRSAALEYLEQLGYEEFDEPFEQNNGIKYTRSEVDFNTAFLIEI